VISGNPFKISVYLFRFMDLSIIILNYKYKDLVKVCLNNLKAADLPLDYEIIVVDNGSNDGIAEMLNNFFPEANLVMLQKNKGYSAGNNAGIKEARGKYVLILNPDVTVGKLAIKRMYDFMEANSDIGITAPQLLNPNRSIQRSCMRFHSFLIPVYRRLSFLQKLSFVQNELDRFEICDWEHNSTREVDWMLGACLMVRKKSFDQAGLFDERFFLFFEDTDLCRRFKIAGWKIYYLVDAKVIHLDERLSNKATGLFALKNKTTWIHIRSWLKYFWKWKGNK